jgi:CheY-like chemotaxis protein
VDAHATRRAIRDQRATGKGHDAQLLPRPTARRHGPRALGIGLAIALHLVELHGCSIHAESAGPDRGSRFRILLPGVALGLGRPEHRLPEPAEAVAAPGDSPDLTGIKILVVEDQQDARDLLTEIIRGAGAEIAEARSVAGAHSFQIFRPDVLVSDIAMPDEDGYSLLRRVRQWPPEEGGLTPAIAVTAYAREEDRIRSVSAGFQLHLPKPFEPVELTTAIWNLVRRRTGLELVELPLAPGGPSFRILLVEDDPDLRDGLRELLEAWGHSVDVATNGPQGIERAIDRRPRVALIDIGLPGLDGYEVAQRIRSHTGTGNITLVALTVYSGPEDL